VQAWHFLPAQVMPVVVGADEGKVSVDDGLRAPLTALRVASASSPGAMAGSARLKLSRVVPGDERGVASRVDAAGLGSAPNDRVQRAMAVASLAEFSSLLPLGQTDSPPVSSADGAALLSEGDALRDQGQWADAALKYFEVLRQHPDSAETHTAHRALLAFEEKVRVGELSTVTDVNDTDTDFEYDHWGRMTSVTSGGNTVAATYDEVGNLLTVTDDRSKVTTYAYDDNNQLTLVTDDDNNKFAYQYESDAGLLTKAGGGATATVDPTTYAYSSTTGLMTKVTYDDGSTTKDITYEYDNLVRVTRMKDWINAVNGIQYAFDDANRITKVTDYDGTEAIT
jgi:YD repeat-containing protein